MAKIKQRNNYSNRKTQVLKANRKKSVSNQICKYFRKSVFLKVILPSVLSNLCKVKYGVMHLWSPVLNGGRRGWSEDDVIPVRASEAPHGSNGLFLSRLVVLACGDPEPTIWQWSCRERKVPGYASFCCFVWGGEHFSISLTHTYTHIHIKQNEISGTYLEMKLKWNFFCYSLFFYVILNVYLFCK